MKKNVEIALLGMSAYIARKVAKHLYAFSLENMDADDLTIEIESIILKELAELLEIEE